jgi:hypothetical protein
VSLSSKTNIEEDPKRSHEKRIGEIPLKMALASKVGRAGCGGNGGQGGQGRGGRSKTPSGTVPCKASEAGDCKDFEGHIFTIGSGNKGKDEDMLCTSMEKMALYIGTKYGNKAAQEWTSGKKIALLEPTNLQAILNRHAERVKATRDRLNLKLTSLKTEKAAIAEEIKANSTNHALLQEMREINNNITKGKIDLKDEVKMKLTKDEKTSHSNVWRSHCESSNSPKKSRGKIYSLLLGKCTQVLVDKMQQDTD